MPKKKPNQTSKTRDRLAAEGKYLDYYLNKYQLFSSPITESNLLPIDYDPPAVKGKRSADQIGEVVLTPVTKSQRQAPKKPLPPIPSKAKGKKPRTKNPAGTPLSRFKAQTIAKRGQLKKARKDIDRELRAIEKDLGVLKKK